MYEISLLDNLKQKIIAPDDLNDEMPTTIEGFEKLLSKKKTQAQKEKIFLEQQLIRRDKLIEIQKERIKRLKQEVDRAMSLMNKRVKPIKEMLDEKLQNLQLALANESIPNGGKNDQQLEQFVY